MYTVTQLLTENNISMKILIVTQAVDRKNIFLGFFVSWIKEFSKNFKEVHIVCLEKGEQELPQNVFVYSMGKDREVSKFVYLFNFYKYIFSLRKKYDVVLVHMNPIYMPLGILFWKLWGKKVALWYTHKHVDFKLRLATFLTDRVFSASKESFRIDTPKLLVTGHGIMTEDFAFTPRLGEEEIKLIIIGRISSIKQTKKAVEILKEVLVGRKASLTIVGDIVTKEDKVYKDELASFIGEEGLTKQVIFKGAIPHDEIPGVLKNNSIMIHTSKTGSVDKVVLEALLGGVLVLTENESFKKALGPAGMFMDETSPKVYKEKVISFSGDKEKFLKAVTTGKKWVEDNHSLKALIPKIKEAYEKLYTSR